jgi:hypothetical protein
MPESGFTIDVDQNQYLPEGGRRRAHRRGPGRRSVGGRRARRQRGDHHHRLLGVDGIPAH